MANKYSDIITLRESKPAYNIQNEEAGEWSSFIANEQFNQILRRVVNSVYNNDADTHKSFWLEGTYGTGKSHAGAVIKHLLCDPIDSIREWIDLEYSDPKYAALRNSIYDLRGKKHLFPVTLYGQSSIAHKSDLSLQLQKAIKQSLSDAGIEITVKTDFDNYISHIESNPEIWDLILDKSPQLRSVAPDRKKLIADLTNSDTDTLTRAEDAMRESGLDVRLDEENLQSWFFEVQDELKSYGEYDGLLILWDEFTDVMTSDIGPSLLVTLQELTEAAMNSKNDSYFFFISHPSALNSLKAEERDKTKGRYNYMKYNMEPVSAFKIMSRKFKIVGSELEYQNLTSTFFMLNEDLLDIYSVSSTHPEETKNDIKSLFPVHPSTANLATFYAREAGSSSRSVFQFLGDNPSIKDFLNSTEEYLNRNTITANYLWDYVVEEFSSNPSKYGAVTERFNAYRKLVDSQGYNFSAVFKSILLLNALNNLLTSSDNADVSPTEENVRNLFRGTNIEDQLDEILVWINEAGVIQKTPSGLYSIQFSALPIKDVEEERQKMLLTQFKYTSQLVKYDETATFHFSKYLRQTMRVMSFAFFGVESNDYVLQKQIENAKKEAKDYELFLAVLVARNSDELSHLKEFAEQKRSEDAFENVIMLVFDAVFGDANYERFIEYQANASCANKHNYTDQQQTNLENAKDMIIAWVKEMRRGVVTIYLKDRQESVSAGKLISTINTEISPAIFTSGAESLDAIKHAASLTYWKKAMVRDTVKTVLSFNTKEDICQHSKGPAMHINYLLQDSVDENLEWKPDVDPNHPLVKVCNFVDGVIKKANKTLTFNLAEKLIDLSRPPYGLYQTYAGMGMFAFAMRKYADKIFDLNGKPHSSQHLIDDVIEVFKSWESGNISQKVTLKFETPEENKVCKKFISVFDLKSFKEYSDISSLKDARWAISHEFIESKGYPLWALKYVDENVSFNPAVVGKISKEDLNSLINYIVQICEESGTTDPAVLADTYELLKKWDFEFKNLIRNSDNYKNGFINFMKSDSIVNLQDAEVNDAVTYIKQHIQSAIGTWTESEVITALKDWRISQQVTPPQPPTHIDPPQYIPPVVPPAPVEDDKRKKAKQKISSMSESDMRNSLDEIISLGYQDVIDIILNN